MNEFFDGVFEGATVFLTGHTGFKGSWLSLWLESLGANVVGFSLAPPTEPSNCVTSRTTEGLAKHHIGDIRDYPALLNAMQQAQPDLVFHLAAQPIVLHSFDDPKSTFETNASGTVNVLEAARHCPSIRAMVMVTSDKCYQNVEWLWGYRENDTLGGTDPYSASKAMAELVINSYRSSFFYKSNSPAIASVRAGNVIGGGDFSDKRIVPDCMKALMDRVPVQVRNPKSVRPWLNVLDPLRGYLMVAANLLKEGHHFAEAWNFGPLEQLGISVEQLVEKAIAQWGEGDWLNVSSPDAKPEMGLLRLSWDKAAHRLGWKPFYDWEAALQQTVDWFKAFDQHRRNPRSVDMRALCFDHIQKFMRSAVTENSEALAK